MKLKIYMRGLGIGIIVTALILGFRSNATRGMISDAEVIERAKQLGMVESGSLTLAEVQNNNEESDGSDEIQEEVDITDQAEPDISLEASDQLPADDADTTTDNTETAGTETDNPSQETSGSTSDKPTTSVPDTSVPMEDKEVMYSDDPVMIRIDPGTGSYTVSKLLYNEGLIKDVNGFDKFLIENGYSTSIQSGIYEILPGTSESDIARLITGK